MPGTRQGSTRPAWAHPQDLVGMLYELKAACPTFDNGSNVYGSHLVFEDLVDIAWMHDLIEDGRKENGSPVRAGDLTEEGIGRASVEAVLALTHNEGEEKVEYLARLLKTLSPQVAVVKCVDRICNLREGAATFKDRRWARYVQETHDYIMPLLTLISEHERAWLKSHLDQGLAARPVVEGV